LECLEADGEVALRAGCRFHFRISTPSLTLYFL
jgi:hypothetical protein